MLDQYATVVGFEYILKMHLGNWCIQMKRNSVYMPGGVYTGAYQIPSWLEIM